MLIFLCNAVSAQTVLRGVVTDGNEPITGASVSIQGTTVGTSTDGNGVFSLNSPIDAGTLIVRFLGFLPSAVSFSENSTDLGTIILKADDAQNLGEVVVVGRGIIDIAEDRQTPIAVSTITPLEIQEKGVGNVEFPEIMKNTPSVYVSNQAGGFGDGQMFLRGFDQSNTTFLLNGQPINGMEDGNMYWSNWSAMSDVANVIQIQRGLGSSKLAISSVGGTVNIVTKATELKRGGFARLMTGDNGYAKATVAYNTGLRGKWGFSFLVDGWRADRKAGILGTAGNGQNYFLSVGFKPNESHNFNFMIFGAPQEHDQNYSKPLESAYRNDGAVLSTPGFDITGKKGNSNYGWYQGDGLSQRRNYYHKPVSNLNWDWTIDEKSSLSTVLYASIGRGGGTGILGNGPGYTANGFSAENGTTNWDVLAELNGALDGGISNGNNGTVLRASVNNHFWYGLVTNYNFDTKKYWTFNVGADLRFYEGDHYQQLVNLLGAQGRRAGSSDGNVNRPADFAVTETFSTNPWSALFSGASEDQRVGYDYTEYINYQGAFGQAEFSKDGFTAFVQGSVSNQSYKKTDRWYFTLGENTSDKENKIGYNIKGGASYTFADMHTIFTNIGKYSRQPFSDNVFVSNSIEFADPEVDNEEIFGFEAGYKFASNLIDVNLNGYYTKWDNRFVGYSVQNLEFEGERYNSASYLLTGIGQVHKGLELDFNWRVMPSLTLRGFGSIGDWKYDGSSPYRIRDNDTYNIIHESTEGLELTGTRVGDAAQTTFGLGVKYYILPHFSVDADYNNYSRLYGITQINDVIGARLNDEVYQPEELDSYNLVDAGLSYTFNLRNGKNVKFRGNVKNLFNEEYFSRKDGYGYFYGLGTTWNAGLTYSF